jgi:UDP-2,3-diacylglucosamine pyrophosphatase LpxH
MKMLRAVAVVLLLALCVGTVPAQEEPPQYEAFQFVVFGDSQPYGRSYAPELSLLATQVGQMDVSFILGAGDYIDGSSNQTTVRRQWENFFSAITPLQANRAIPVAFAPGNHDIGGIRRNAEIFCEHFEKLYRSFNFGGCHFIILDSETIGADARVTGTQLQWLRQDLEAAKAARLTFVVMHRPLFPVDGNIGFSLDKHPRERDALHALFIESGVDAVFHGHEHLYHHQERDGIHYFITGGAGAKPYVEPENGGFHHYLLVSVNDDGFVVEVQRLNP